MTVEMMGEGEGRSEKGGLGMTVEPMGEREGKLD